MTAIVEKSKTILIYIIIHSLFKLSTKLVLKFTILRISTIQAQTFLNALNLSTEYNCEHYCI